MTVGYVNLEKYYKNILFCQNIGFNYILNLGPYIMLIVTQPTAYFL